MGLTSWLLNIVLLYFSLMNPVYKFERRRPDSISIPTHFQNVDALAHWLEETFGSKNSQQVSQERRCITNGNTVSE